jgi:hypothetical protein
VEKRQTATGEDPVVGREYYLTRTIQLDGADPLLVGSVVMTREEYRERGAETRYLVMCCGKKAYVYASDLSDDDPVPDHTEATR